MSPSERILALQLFHETVVLRRTSLDGRAVDEPGNAKASKAKDPGYDSRDRRRETGPRHDHGNGANHKPGKTEQDVAPRNVASSRVVTGEVTIPDPFGGADDPGDSSQNDCEVRQVAEQPGYPTVVPGTEACRGVTRDSDENANTEQREQELVRLHWAYLRGVVID